VLTEPALITALRQHWDLTDIRLTVHNGGMGSQTWFVGQAGRRWVAKAVAPAGGSQFATAMGIAQHLERAGIPAGAPLPAASGRLAVDLGAAWLALLTWVPGRELTGEDAAEQQIIGMTLARVHRALADCRVATAERFHWVDPDAACLSQRPWLRPAIVAALELLDAADPASMSQGLLHADPAPGAFRLDPATGRCAVIDWSYALRGPLLYDLASAVMYCGGPSAARPLIEAYLRAGTLKTAEVEHGLAAMLRFRWAVQANYFAWRIAENDLTGISGPQDNEKGLEDARRFLTGSVH
jgi:Ser/Thr protein kinase RdoA (MazF antagonist)